MIIEEIKRISSTRKDLRNFGFVMGVALLVITLVIYFFSSKITTPLLWIGLAFEVLGLVAPNILLPFHKIWMSLSIILGIIMTFIILCSLYYLIVTPMALAGRLLGKKFLETKYDKDAATYWECRPSQTTGDLERYKKQF